MPGSPAYPPIPPVADPSSPTTLTIGAVTCTVAIRGDGTNAIREEITWDGGPKATVQLQCRWEDHYDLIRALAGAVVGASGSITRIPPFPYPNSPNMYVHDVLNITGIKPQRDTTGFLRYKHCTMDVVFLPPRWGFVEGDDASQNDPSGKPWTTTRVKVSAEVFQPSKGTYYFTAGPQMGAAIPDGSLGIIRPRSEISVTRHWMPYLPIEEMETYAGTVNSVPVTIGNKTYEVGTLLFTTGNALDGLDTIGNRTEEIEYIFLGNGRGVDWNAVLSTDGLFYVVNSAADASGAYPYAYADAWNNLP